MPSTSPSPNRGSDRIGYAVGVAFIVLGGLVAAATAPLGIPRGSWLAAYLVLVGGVAQCLMSRQRSLLGGDGASPARQWARFTLWNLGNALVVVGSLSVLPLLTDAGGLCLLAALLLAADATRRTERRSAAVILRVAYLALAVSIPIGLTLTHLRALHPAA